MGLGNLLFTLGLRTGPFESALKGATGSVSNFANDIKGRLASAFSVGAMVMWTKSVVDATARIKDLSEQTGISTDEVQQADFALKQSGLQFEDLNTALVKVNQSRRDAVQGNEQLRKTFERMGVTLRDLNDPQKRNFDLLMQVSDALGKTNMTASEQTQVMDLLGAKAGKLSIVLRELSAIKPPVLFNQSDIMAIDRVEKALQRLKLQGQVASAKGITGALDVGKGILDFGKNQLDLLMARLTGGEAPKAKTLGGSVMEAFSKSRVTEPFAEMLGGLFQGIVKNGLGFQSAPLFEEDKDKKIKESRSSTAAFKRQSPDSLVAVGNFLGGDPTSRMTNQVKRINDMLTKIERWTKKTAEGGIVIRK